MTIEEELQEIQKEKEKEKLAKLLLQPNYCFVLLELTLFFEREGVLLIYLVICNNSTSKRKVAPGAMTGGEPPSP